MKSVLGRFYFKIVSDLQKICKDRAGFRNLLRSLPLLLPLLQFVITVTDSDATLSPSAIDSFPQISIVGPFLDDPVQDTSLHSVISSP